MARTVHCIKLGKDAEGLDFPPYPGELGKRLWEGVSKQAWADWLKHQTMLVNENRLNLADARARQYLARQMEQHFFGGGADAVQGYVPPPSAYARWPVCLWAPCGVPFLLCRPFLRNAAHVTCFFCPAASASPCNR